MSKTKTSSKSAQKVEDKSFLERLPDSVPFAPVVRRPDYQLRFVKFSAPTSIPIELIIVILGIGLFFIYIGGFYDLAQNNIVAFGSDSTGDPLVIYPSQLDEQFLVEGMAAGLLMFIGAGGFFLIYYATQYAYSPRNSIIMLVVGIGIVVICWVAVMWMLSIKLGTSLLSNR
ncbi:MAG TPA: hypothetical protein VMX55_12745 [candidate division Zixibacteria bacterium]|nr:hypothetical protein [candidate division Zixibacteria bacterium]